VGLGQELDIGYTKWNIMLEYGVAIDIEGPMQLLRGSRLFRLGITRS
jgi:hypothetical protein